MKQELAPESKRAEVGMRWYLDVLSSTSVEKTGLTWPDRMEPLLRTNLICLGLSNQMAPILAGLTRLTHLLIGSRHQV